MSAFIVYRPTSIGGGGGGFGIASINADITAAQTLTVGTSGTDFAIVDAGSGSHVFNLPTASASNRGALSSADWSTFNGKQSALTFGNLTSSPTTNLVVTGGTGAVIGSGALLTLTGASLVEATSSVLTITGATNAVLGTGVSIQVKQAATAQSGYLSSTDWNTFNGKQAAGNYITALTGDGTAAGPGSSALTLATVNSNVGSFGSATQVTALTVNGKGLVTAAASTAIQIAESQVTNLVSDLAGKQATLTIGNLTEATSSVLTISGGTGAIIGSGLTIQVKAASTSQSGYLSNTDWNTFNGKQAAGTYVTSLTVTTGNGVSGSFTAGATPALSLTLGAITPTTVNGNTLTTGTGTLTLSTFTLTASGTASISGTHTGTSSGTNTGDQTITLTSDVTGSGTGSFATTIAASAVTLAKMANLAANSIIGNNTGSSATPLALTATQTRALITKAPTVQAFTSSSGTYTTPAGTSYIRVRAIGGGGGGGADGTAGATGGGTGGTTTFGSSLISCVGGTGGAASGGGGGAGGTATLGSGPIGLALSGGAGTGGQQSATLIASMGGPGGNGCFGGGGGGGPANAAGGAGTANTGGGGGGAGANGSVTELSGAGGGSGGFVDGLISSPSATYSYAVGAAGTAGSAGTSGNAGGAGGSGYIIVEEYYL